MIGPRPDLALAGGYHSPQLDVAVRLNTNESPEPPPEAFADALRDEVLPGLPWHRYPDREAGALREAIGVEHGLGSAWVFAASGSNEVLQTLLLTYGGPGRTALVWEPTYALHAHLARITATEVAVAQRPAGFDLASEEVGDAIRSRRPSVVFLCSPNNPTGTVDDPSVARAAVDAAAEVDALVIVDEAYGQFTRCSAQGLLGDGVPLVVVRTFSKTWAMAGARLGYALAPPEIVSACLEVVLPYHLDAFTQAAGLVALRFGDEMRARVERLVAERERLVAGLGALAVDQWPSGANFVLFRPRGRSGTEIWQALVDRSVLVRDCSSWPALDDCLRVTVGTPEENDRFLKALEEALAT